MLGLTAKHAQETFNFRLRYALYMQHIMTEYIVILGTKNIT